jgi:hypothetical protein
VIKTGLPTAGAMVNSLGCKLIAFDVLLVEVDGLVFLCSFFVGRRLFAMVFRASLQSQWVCPTS